MTWNYRIIDHGNYKALHEVYYRDDVPWSHSAGPIGFVCDDDEDAGEIVKALKRAVRDAKRHSVLTPADFPDGKA